VSIAAASAAACALAADGTVSCWGENDRGQLGQPDRMDRSDATQVPGLSGVASIHGGDAFFCAVHSDGAVSCWGAGEAAQLGDGSAADSAVPRTLAGAADVVDMALGSEFACVLRDGDIRCLGSAAGSQLGAGRPFSLQPLGATPGPI